MLIGQGASGGGGRKGFGGLFYTRPASRTVDSEYISDEEREERISTSLVKGSGLGSSDLMREKE